MRRWAWSAALMASVALLSGAAARAQPATGRARQAYDRAIRLAAEGNHPAALSLLWEASGLAPGDADVHHRLGEALERIGALDAAVDAYRRALAARPGFRQADHDLILVLVKAGKGAEAAARAQMRADAAPSDPDAHFTLGLALAEQDVTAAIASFGRVLALAPRHALARYNLALVLKRADRLPEAIAELERAIAIEPRAEIHYTLGVIFWHGGDLARAERELAAAVALDPDYVDGHFTLGAIRQTARDWQGAARSLRRAIALSPALWSAHYTLGRVLIQAGNRAAGDAELATAERLRLRAAREQEASVWTATGTARLEAGDLDGAVERFRRATAIYEPYAPAHYQMGRALVGLGQQAAADAAFARAEQLNPSLARPRQLP